jgi:transposase
MLFRKPSWLSTTLHVNVRCTPKVGQKNQRKKGVPMRKLTKEQRLTAAIAVDQGSSYLEAGRANGMCISSVRDAYKQYKATGTITLGSTTKRWPLEMKLKAIQYRKDNHLTYFQAAIELGILNQSSIYLWEKAYMENGTDGLQPKRTAKKKDPKPKEPLSELEKLKEENEYLRAENAYLKKVQELIDELKKKKK